MKKILCLLIAVSMIVGLVACQSAVETPLGTPSESVEQTSNASPEVSSDSESLEPSDVTIPSDLPEKKIGVMSVSYANTIGVQYKNSLEKLADAFNIELVLLEMGTSSEQAQAVFESALQTGLDGLITVGTSTAQLEACKKAGIPVVVYGTGPIDEQQEQGFAGFDNFFGTIGESNYELGINAAEALYEAGCRKIGAVGITEGLSRTQDDRMKSFRDGVDKYEDMEIIAEDLSMGKFGEAISSFAAAYPEMDGIFAADMPEAVYQAIANEGLVGRVKLASIGVCDATKDYFENGTLVYATGGDIGSLMLSFPVMYNYIYDGTLLIPDRDTVWMDPFKMYSSEDYDIYLKEATGDAIVYTPEELAAMIVGFNPQFTPEDFEQIVSDYSLQDVFTRHSGMN